MCLWLYSVPWVWLGILIVTIFVLVGLAGLSLARRLILPGLGHVAHQNEVTGAILHGILIIYGLAVALIAIAVWESYSDVTKVVSEEATAIASLYRDFSGYPEPTRTQLRDDLRAYDQIIHGAWPIQRRGGTPTEGVVMMTSVQDRLFAFDPATEAQKILHAETLHAYNELILARRLRVDALGSGLPPAMWAVVLNGFIKVVLQGRAGRAHAAPTRVPRDRRWPGRATQGAHRRAPRIQSPGCRPAGARSAVERLAAADDRNGHAAPTTSRAGRPHPA